MNPCLSQSKFGLGISVSPHEAGAEQLWDKEVLPSSGQFIMGKDHGWAEQAQGKLKKRAARKGCFAGKSCSRGTVSAAILPRAVVERGFSSMGQSRVMSGSFAKQEAVSVYRSGCLRVGGGYRCGTRGGHWPGAYGEVVSRVGWSGWRARQWDLAEYSSRVSLQPDMLCQWKRRFWWSRHSWGESFPCVAASEKSPLQQNCRESLTEGLGLNVSPRHSGVLCLAVDG